jgi:hypothetical protein
MPKKTPTGIRGIVLMVNRPRRLSVSGMQNQENKKRRPQQICTAVFLVLTCIAEGVVYLRRLSNARPPNPSRAMVAGSGTMYNPVGVVEPFSQPPIAATSVEVNA